MADKPLVEKFVKNKVKKNDHVIATMKVNGSGRMTFTELGKKTEPGTLIKKFLEAGKYTKIWSNKSNNNQIQIQNQQREKDFCMEDDRRFQEDEEEYNSLGIASGGNGNSSGDGNLFGFEVGQNGKNRGDVKLDIWKWPKRKKKYVKFDIRKWMKMKKRHV